MNEPRYSFTIDFFDPIAFESLPHHVSPKPRAHTQAAAISSRIRQRVWRGLGWKMAANRDGRDGWKHDSSHLLKL